MLWLEIEAPFAACRPFVAGWYRPTAAFLTHSAICGLMLNIARIESRLWEHEDGHGGKAPASLLRADLPRFRLAIGLPQGAEPPRVTSLFQQLHNYPVGKDAGLSPELAKSHKNNIAPVRRELLCDVRAVAVIDADDELESKIRLGLGGDLNAGRYGLPFLGDNSFTIDRLEEIDPRPTRWYALVAERAGRPLSGTTRLTTHIGRVEMSATRSALFAPSSDLQSEPPESALVPVGSPDEFDRWLASHATPTSPR